MAGPKSNCHATQIENMSVSSRAVRSGPMAARRRVVEEARRPGPADGPPEPDGPVSASRRRCHRHQPSVNTAGAQLKRHVALRGHRRMTFVPSQPGVPVGGFGGPLSCDQTSEFWPRPSRRRGSPASGPSADKR